jgi:hypothetical protein
MLLPVEAEIVIAGANVPETCSVAADDMAESALLLTLQRY